MISRNDKYRGRSLRTRTLWEQKIIESEVQPDTPKHDQTQQEQPIDVPEKLTDAENIAFPFNASHCTNVTSQLRPRTSGLSHSWKWIFVLKWTYKFLHNCIMITILAEINAHPEIIAHQKQWFFKGGSTWNRWALMGDFSKGGVHETDGVPGWFFQRGEYTKPMGSGMFFYCF